MNKEAKNLRLERRNEKIKKRFLKLSDKKYKDVKLYSSNAVFEMLADEFYLSPITIEKIIFNKD